MSLHPSLTTSEKDKKQRSVLKRAERIRSMMEKGTWKEGDKVYGLPKIKTLRIRIKKEKVEKAETGIEGAAAAATSATETKTEASPKAAPGKTQEKK